MLWPCLLGRIGTVYMTQSIPAAISPYQACTRYVRLGPHGVKRNFPRAIYGFCNTYDTWVRIGSCIATRHCDHGLVYGDENNNSTNQLLPLILQSPTPVNPTHNIGWAWLRYWMTPCWYDRGTILFVFFRPILWVLSVIIFFVLYLACFVGQDW